MEAKKSTWSILSKIDCSNKIEKKNGLTYLSWAWAWGIAKENFPTANYQIEYFDGKPYLFDENLGYLIVTNVTIDNETIRMQLPVMDGANKAQTNKAYTYTVADMKWDDNAKKKVKVGEVTKKVEAVTMFDINTAIMRCLTKNLAMFGLGHYIYAGEDLPVEIPNVEANEEKEKSLKEKLQAEEIKATEEMSKCKDEKEVAFVWAKFPMFQSKGSIFYNKCIEVQTLIKKPKTNE